MYSLFISFRYHDPRCNKLCEKSQWFFDELLVINAWELYVLSCLSIAVLSTFSWCKNITTLANAYDSSITCVFYFFIFFFGLHFRFCWNLISERFTFWSSMQKSIPSEKDIWFWQKIWRVTYYMILLKLEKQ